MASSETAPKPISALGAGAEIEIDFTDLLANGQGVGRASGIVVFCFGPLPHERARVRVTEVKQRYAVAEMIELISPSSDRAEPFCPVFGTCGGCQVQHVAYSAQLAWKRDTVRNALQRIGGFTAVSVGETVGMENPRQYRNKMSLVVDHNTSPPALGFYRQRSHDVVAIDACPIVEPSLDALLGALDAMRGEPVVAGMLRQARHLVARSAAAGHDVALTITTQRQSQDVTRAAPLLMKKMPGLAGMTNSFDPGSSNAILGRRHRELAGKAAIEEEIGGIRYRVSTSSFFQVNPAMVRKIFEYLDRRLGRPGRMVDLYCGVGMFALYFAKRGWNVVGVEENAQALAEAEVNARINRVEGCVTFVRGRVELLAGMRRLEQAIQEAHVLFLDPPRKGCDPAALEAMGQARVPILWYLSCDAATLARDLKFLVAKGYELDTVQPFDMFPQTGHVETLVRLEYPNRVVR